MADHTANRTCEKCGKAFYTHPCRIAKGTGRFCSRKCWLSRSLRERFASFIGKPTETGCILWQGAKRNEGYGYILDNGEVRRALSAHRVAWELANGPIPDGLLVCHKCDVPLCVAIEHLFLGTHQDNSTDAVKKGRTPKGEKSGNVVLTERQACEIIRRRQAGEIIATIAAVFGVSEHCVQSITSGRT
jgi:HNH endonuclease